MEDWDELGARARKLRLAVAIDGPSGSGKSTLAAALARRLACVYVDTGLMYRAVALKAEQLGVPLDGASLAQVARDISFDVAGTPPELSIDGRPPTSELHSGLVDGLVSMVAAQPEVRRILVHRQRELADGRCVVMAGRDIGTTVLPDAPVKLWVTAPAEVRAARRGAERPREARDFQQALRERDRVDSQRTVSPLRRTDDAIEIDTGVLDPEETVQAAGRAVAAAVERLQSCMTEEQR